MTIKPGLVFRVDAGTQMGTGHVMRCLALAQAWQDAGGAAHFAAVELPEGLATRLAAEGMVLHRLEVVPGSHDDAAQTAALAHSLGATWVVEDGYHFGADYQLAIKEAGLRLLAVDDYGHAIHYVADLVLNQNVYADGSFYPSRESYTQLLLGTQYVLLRREFWPWRGWQRDIPEVARNILVTMGGGDPDNQTAKVLRAIQQADLGEPAVTIVVGAGNPHFHELQCAAQEAPFTTRIARNVSNMPDLMARADVAISAAGSTCWELAFMALPSLLLILAENQRNAAETLSHAEVVRNLGEAENVDVEAIRESLVTLVSSPETRTIMSQKGKLLVDGSGTNRVLEFLE